MSAFAEKLSHGIYEESDDSLSRKELSSQIHTIGEALQHPAKLRSLAQSQQMGQYSNHELVPHYVNHRRQYQQFYDMLYGKRRISEGEVHAIVRSSRRGRR